MGFLGHNDENQPTTTTSYFIVTHFTTYGRFWPQTFSCQDVPMNYILHICEIHQVGPITTHRKEVNK